VYVRWHRTAKWGFSIPFAHWWGPKLEAIPIFQTVSEEDFCELRLYRVSEGGFGLRFVTSCLL
jgi:hypothetical protein